MKPLRQGDVDSLCGLYSIINSIRICSSVWASLSQPQAKAVFGELIKHYEATFPTFARVGMDGDQVEAALKFALKLCREKYSLHISYRYVEFRGLKVMQDALAEHLSEDIRRAAIISVDAHCTVVTEVAGPLWQLCDSYRYKHLYCIGQRERTRRGDRLLRARPELHAFLLKHEKGPKYGIGDGPKGTALLGGSTLSLITDEQKAELLNNGRRSADGEAIDPQPVVKLFTPDGAATWLLTELDPSDPDRAFGLCDLGLGFPELGYVSLREIQSVRGRLGLHVERDLWFKASKPLSVYAEAAARHERIVDVP